MQATFGVLGAGAGAGAGAEQSSYAYIRTSGVTAGGTAGAGGGSAPLRFSLELIVIQINKLSPRIVCLILWGI